MGQAQYALLQVILLDAELAKMNARRGELRNQLLHFVAQHGSLTIVGIATARLLEQLSKVSYAAKHVDQVGLTCA